MTTRITEQLTRLAAISALLLTAACNKPAEIPAEPVAGGAAETWAQRCAFCHGATGSGDTPTGGAWPAANLVDTTWKFGSSKAEIEAVIRTGSPGTPMPGFDRTLTPAEISELAVYVQSLSR